MRKITKIVLLTDEKTSALGRQFMLELEQVLNEMKLKTVPLDIHIARDLWKGAAEFDRISQEIRPDMLIVADFACITSKSTEEEPYYVNMSIPVIHLLFKRPWEYNEFWIWRWNFTTRCYCMLGEDREYIGAYYKRILNRNVLPETLWNLPAKTCCYLEVFGSGQLKERLAEKPEYLNVIAERWQTLVKQSRQGDAQTLRQCLREIGFSCTDEEYLDVMYLMQDHFAAYYKNRDNLECEAVTIDRITLTQLAEEFLEMDFPVTLLT